MRAEIDTLRDIATVSRHLLARYPFDSKDELAFHWRYLALLHAELIALRDHTAREEARVVDPNPDPEGDVKALLYPPSSKLNCPSCGWPSRLYDATCVDVWHDSDDDEDEGIEHDIGGEG